MQKGFHLFVAVEYTEGRLSDLKYRTDPKGGFPVRFNTQTVALSHNNSVPKLCPVSKLLEKYTQKKEYLQAKEDLAKSN